MKKPSANTTAAVLPLLESVCHLIALPLSLSSLSLSFYLLTQELDTEAVNASVDAETMSKLEDAASGDSGQWILVALLAVLALSMLFHAFVHREEGEAAFVTSLLRSAALAGCAVLSAARAYDMTTLFVVSVVYAAEVLAGIVVSLIRDHRIRRLIPGIMMAGVLFFCATSYILIFPLIALLSIASLMRFVFSRLNIRMLGQIIRKTYAAEIVFGLVLLIFTFSYLLQIVEPYINDYWDAVWYCFAIVTTIGFGDITAVTLPGRILSVVLGVYGIVVVALITSVIVNFYGEMRRESRQNPPDRQAEEAPPPVS